MNENWNMRVMVRQTSLRDVRLWLGHCPDVLIKKKKKGNKRTHTILPPVTLKERNMITATQEN